MKRSAKTVTESDGDGGTGARDSGTRPSTPLAQSADVAACELCGDYYDADELTECETCTWKMCPACEYDEGNCRDCALELGLITEDE